MTRKVLLYLAFLFSACGPKETIENKPSTLSQVDNSAAILSKTIIEHVNKPYFVGDINNDGYPDSAFVTYDRRIRADSTIEKECLNNNCEVTIKFTDKIPDLTIDQSLGIHIEKAEDLNNDNANELILYSEWFEGFWFNIYVWTFKNGRWKELARTKAMLSDEKDFENRIIKKNSCFFLVGDGWDDKQGGLTARSIKIKIEKVAGP